MPFGAASHVLTSKTALKHQLPGSPWGSSLPPAPTHRSQVNLPSLPSELDFVPPHVHRAHPYNNAVPTFLQNTSNHPFALPWNTECAPALHVQGGVSEARDVWMKTSQFPPWETQSNGGRRACDVVETDTPQQETPRGRECALPPHYHHHHQSHSCPRCTRQHSERFT